MTELKLFLSHSGLDATLSISMKTSIEGHFSALGHHITVFNTSTPCDRFKTLPSYLDPGTLRTPDATRYENELEQYLLENVSDASAYLLLVTPESLAANSHWVRLEIDWALYRATHDPRYPFFPCLAGGVSVKQLPDGAQEFTELRLDDSTWLENLAHSLLR